MIVRHLRWPIANPEDCVVPIAIMLTTLAS